MPNLTLEEQFNYLASLQPTGDEETDWLYPINPLSIEQGKAFVQTMEQLVKDAGLEWIEPRVNAGQAHETEIEWSWYKNSGTPEFRAVILLFYFYGDELGADDDPDVGFMMTRNPDKIETYTDLEPATLLGAYQAFLGFIKESDIGQEQNNG